MPNIDAAKKYMRVSARKRTENNRWKHRLDGLRRRFGKAVGEKNVADARTVFQDFQKTLDAAARRHVLHRNAAARTKSRLSAALARLTGA